ncbi:ATP-binding protein [Desulfosporosinus sp. FKA]|uniref:ATP-binding protein n=1 Tax=Desulfosporosinus sp. FKA TaxID=1969834 RepID=UPI000B49E0E9|nr:ATP-binding protein [Desulfosporosinus sp. FKA]
MSLIGRIIATEKVPTTIDSFCFWTNTDLILNPFDVVKVEHIKGSKTFAVIEEISHITDSASFLSNFISNDFGDVNTDAPTLRIGMNYVRANVVGNDKNIFIPVQSGQRVYLASRDEVSEALGLSDIKNPLVCGYLEMYESSGDNNKITLPVNVDSNFLIGPEGAHLNISGISGLAAKTSYAMFLLKAIQDKYLNKEEDDENDSVAFVVFNVKGRDLLAIDEPNDFGGETERAEVVKDKYKMLKLSTKPFSQVKYFYPYSTKTKSNSYAPKELFDKQKQQKKAFQYKFTYEQDKDTIDLMFSNIEDSTQTMAGIINQIIDGQNGFNLVSTWQNFIRKLEEQCESGNTSSTRNKEIGVVSWRKFTRLIKKSVHNNPLFNDLSEGNGEVRIADKISEIQKNDVYVIDIAKLDTDMQSYVFGNVIRELYNFQLEEKAFSNGKYPPSKIIVFIDELNKFASKDSPKDSPILKQILDIAERGRSLGVVLFAAEQFKSAIHNRVSGNCSTFAYGRTNAIELSNSEYKYIPSVYKNMMTRLKQGEYIVQNPIFRSLLNIKFPEPIYKQFKS